MIKDALEQAGYLNDHLQIRQNLPYQYHQPSYETFKKSQLTKEETSKMFDYARNLKIDIFTTVTDQETASWISKLKPSAFNLFSSGGLNHIPFINHLCSYDEPIYISTVTGI